MDDDKSPYTGSGAGHNVGEDAAEQLGIAQVGVFLAGTLSCERLTAVSGE